jgi:anti-anti-sigma regulatory factor
MAWIDLKDMLGRTVSGLYGDLVTRRTGHAVRCGIERLLDGGGSEVAVIDFRDVRLMDHSCADEIIGKLLLQQGTARYFLLTGLDPSHEDAIGPVLERHGLAVVARDRGGVLKLLGALPEPARRAFRLLADDGPAVPDEVAAKLALTRDDALAALKLLCARRVVREQGGHYQALRTA